MNKILCVEDNLEFQFFLKSILKDYALTQVSTVKDALRAVDDNSDFFDLILLDVSLPDGNGMKVLPKLRELASNKAIPIIVISSDSDVFSKVAAFGIGADDYIEKPPEPNELRARIEARLRWARSQFESSLTLNLGNLRVDCGRMVVEIVGDNGLTSDTLSLTPIEFKVLRLLIGRPEQVFSRDQIVEKVWGNGYHVTSRTVDAHVSHLRRKMHASNANIETVLLGGYKICLKDKSSK